MIGAGAGLIALVTAGYCLFKRRDVIINRRDVVIKRDVIVR